MIAFVIAYSAILLLVASSAVLVCVIAMRSRHSEQTTAEVADGGLFVAVYGGGAACAFLLFETESGLPVYVSENVTAFFGIGAQEAFRDAEALKRNLAREDARALENALRDRKSTRLNSSHIH